MTLICCSTIDSLKTTLATNYGKIVPSYGVQEEETRHGNNFRSLRRALRKLHEAASIKT
ncbi:MAG: hypothetical protein QW369_03635 [Desulfurococcaceae archaeon]